nr:MAG TPA: hypothetical protein [Caudoviricetes sp.]
MWRRSDNPHTAGSVRRVKSCMGEYRSGRQVRQGASRFG